jgi:hypothetical protein
MYKEVDLVRKTDNHQLLISPRTTIMDKLKQDLILETKESINNFFCKRCN